LAGFLTRAISTLFTTGEASIFNLIPWAAAFAVVALIILFGHPAEWGGTATRMGVNVGAGAQVISSPTAAG
jgi:hypothetical protein